MKSRMPTDYQIPDNPDAGQMDAAFLRSCLGMKVKPGETPPELPDAVRRAHYDMARSLSILGACGPNGMNPTQLATVVALALRDGAKIQKERPSGPTFLDEVYGGRVVAGQKVVVNWRMKDHPAHFLETDGEKIRVLIHGNEMNFRPDLVSHAKDGEFSEVANNINEPVEV